MLESDLLALAQELVEVDRRLVQLRLSLPPAYSSNYSTPEGVRREGSVEGGSISSSLQSDISGSIASSLQSEGRENKAPSSR